MDRVQLIFVLSGIFMILGGSIIAIQAENPKPNKFEENKTEMVDNSSDEVHDVVNKSERYIQNFFAKNKTWKVENESNINYNRSIYEVTRFNQEKTTRKQLERAWKLYNNTFNSAKENNWFNYDKAKDDEFNNTFSVDHYVNLKNYRDEESLNPDKPEFLIFMNNTDNEKVLAGVMYMKSGVDKEGRQVGGPLTLWHYHTYPREKCYYNGFAASRTPSCPENYYSDRSPEMIHVWFVDHPGKTFGTNMYVPKESLDKGPQKMNKSEFTTEQIKLHGGLK